MKIPKSEWVLKKVYFRAKPVDDFKKKYLSWMQDYNGGVSQSDMSFAEYITSFEVVELYGFPEHDGKDAVDFFEKHEDNHVIPRHLFEPV